jgi:cystathionine beta-lyase
MGALICKDDALAERLYFIQKSSGAVCGPQDSFLALRGTKTLHLRMQRHSENGKKIAQFLTEHPKVENVYWPGFKEHPNHSIARSQMRDYGGMISFSLKGNSKDDAFKVMSTFKIFTLAESLGGVESLTCHPATMTHTSIPAEEREKLGIVESLIRLSVGIEDIHDLIEDLDSALKSV